MTQVVKIESFLVPLPPLALRITGEMHSNMETTVSLEWDPPQGSGPETVVDNYNISIFPNPPYQPANILVSSQNTTVILEHNELYTINVTAVNCAGESRQALMLSIEYGKCLQESIMFMIYKGYYQ